MKHFLTFLRRGLGLTLALTVGSPSADRRLTVGGTTLKHLTFMLLFLIGSLNVWGAKITNYTSIESGKKYYIGATTGNTDYYLSVNGSSTSTSIAGSAVTSASSATVFVFAGSGTSWTIKFDDSDYYLGLKNGKDNGKVQVVESSATFTASNQSSKIRFTIGSYSVQKNNSGTQFGSYANTQTDVWLEEVPGGPSEPTALDVPTGMSSGTPTMTSATLSWNVVEHADGYALTIGTNDPITTGFTTDNGVVSYTLSNLTADTEYTWKVKATTTDTENYSNSADCEAQNFTTADDPSLLSLIFDLSSNPGEWPTDNSTTTTNYVYTLDEVDYTFALNNVKCNSGYLMMTTTAVLGLPAVSGYKLVKVIASNSSSCSTAAEVEITADASEGTAVSGGTKQQWSTQSSAYTYNLIGTAYNTMYYMRSVKSGKNTQVTQIKLKYQAKPAVSSIAIKTAPAKTTYTANETFNPAGMVITVNYSDNTHEDVAYDDNASDFSFSPTTSTALNATNESVTVTYCTKTASQSITVNRIATSLSWSANSYAANAGSTYSFPTLTTEPTNLAGVTYSSSNEDLATIDENGDIMVDDENITESTSTTITAAFSQTDVYEAAVSKSYTLTINPASSPSLEVDPTSLTFDLTEVEQSSELEFTLIGEYLEADATISITGTNAAMFSVAAADETIEKDNDDVILANVTVTYSPTAAGNHSATLTISSTDATSVEVALSGSANVRRSVTWVTGTEASAAGGTASVWDGAAITAMPTQPTSCDEAISFMGWTDAEYAKSDNAPEHLYTQVSDFPAISGGNATYYAVWAEVKDKNGSVKIDASVNGYPTTYGSKNAFDDLEVDGYAFKIQQLTTNNGNMQWRASGNDNGTGTIYNNEVFLGHISSVGVVFAENDANKNHTLMIGNSANPTSGTEIIPSTSGSTYTFDCSGYSYDYFVLTNGTNAGYTESVTINYSYSVTKNYTTTCTAPVEITDPTFDVEGGIYTEIKTVKISNYNSNYYYFYTLDGTTPAADVNWSPKGTSVAYNHTTGIAINESCTLKVIAYDADANTSDVTSATYTLNLPLTLAQFVAQKPTTDKDIDLTDAIVLGAQGKFIYVQQGEAAMALYNSNPASWVKGNKVTGIITGKYNGSYDIPEMQVSSFGEATATGSFEMPTPLEITEENAAATLVEGNMFRYAEIKDVTFDVEENYPVVRTSSDYYYYEDALSVITGKVLPGTTVSCDVKGIIYPYKSSGSFYYEQLAPIALSDIAAKNATSVLPAISPEGGANAGSAVQVTYLSTVSVPLVENEKIYVSVNDAEATDPIEEAASIQIEGDVKLTVTAKRDFYADNSVTYYYKPSAYPKSITKVSAHGTMTVKVEENEVSTALPTSTVEVTISDIESHFTLTGVTVKDADNGDVDVNESEGVYSFTMPNKNVTITANYDEDDHYTITYATSGDATGNAPAGAPTWQYEGEDVTLPANSYTWDDDHSFTGWKVTYGEIELDEAVGATFQMPASNVTITAQWAEKQNCKLTLKVNGANYLVKNIEQDVEQTISALEGYADPEDVGAYEFIGWAATAEDDDVEDAIATIETYTPAVGETAKTLYAVFKRVYEGEEKTDVLTISDLGVTATSYTAFSNVQKISSAKYAGKVACNNNANIQLKSKDSEAGIVSTISGGLLKSVKINVASGSNTVDVYGSNTEYASAAELYGSSAIGTKIGGTSSTATINADADYKYVGIRSYSGAAYLSSVEITWQPKATYYTTHPAEVCDVTYNLGTSPAGAWKENDGCENTKVKSGLTYDICEDEPIREHFNFNGWLIGGQAASGTITITGNTEIVADWSAKVERTLTYDKGTASGTNVITNEVEEGTEITLPAIGTGSGQVNFTKDGYDFKGWKYGNKLYKAGETFVMPNEVAILVAQWKKQNTEKFTLVTDASQLINGSRVVLANQTNEVVAGASVAETESYLASISATFNDTKSIITDINTGIQLILVECGDGWALMYNNKYLKPHSTNKISWDATPTKWYISFSGNDAIIETGNVTTGSAMRYNDNSGSLRFAAYSTKTSCKPIQLYASSTVIDENMNVSDLGYVEDDAIVASGNITLTIDVPTTAGSIAATNGATIVVNNPLTVTEEGIKLGVNDKIVINNAITAPSFSIAVKMGGVTVDNTSIGEATEVELTENGSISTQATGYIDLELVNNGRGGAGQWHAFTVPFPVDAMTGVYDATNDAEHLINEVNYAIMSYDSERRSNGEYGWKKDRGILQPGTFYLITVDGNSPVLRLKKTSSGDYFANNEVQMTYWGDGNIENPNNGWCGVGNPNMFGGYVTDFAVQMLNDAGTAYVTYPANQAKFSAAMPFFIKITATVNLTISTTPSLAPMRTQVNEFKNIAVDFFNASYKDRLYISANEDALTSYEEGKDLLKMTMSSTPTIPQIFGKAYGKKLSIVDAPLTNDQAVYDIDLYAPTAGTYSLSAAAIEGADLYVTYEGQIIWNLSLGEYELDLTRGTTTGYGLLLVAQPNQMPTGVENGELLNGENGVQKILLNGNLYILRDGHLYDAVGKQAR